MSPGAAVHGPYPSARELEQRWRELGARLGGQESVVGRSVEGRPLWRFDLGSRRPGAPVVLLSALIHGVEVIGSLALLDAMASLGDPRGAIAERCRLVVLPILNPDAFAANMDRLARGRIAFQRKNANRVDLNRNFPPVAGARSWHPFSGSPWRFSPHHRGPHPFSEPETRAVRDVVLETRPRFALGFHSFGNLLLYPWAHSRVPNPRADAYRSLSRAFAEHLPGPRYACRQAIDFYPTIGDLDDWLDATLGTLALTVEVSQLDRRLVHPLRLLNPFCWMNPLRIEETLGNLRPGVLGLVSAALSAVA